MSNVPATAILDGDFKGHPFRGSQYRKANQGSGSAVSSSMKAKHAEKHGDPKAQKKAHKTAYFSHMAAAEEAKGVTRKYHRKMAKFHGGRAGVVMDSASVFDDASGGYESIVGVIKKGAQVVGRAQVGGDGKAMIFTGESGGTRIKYLSKVDGALRDFMWSDDDVGDMVDALFTVPENGVAKEPDPAPVVPAPTPEPVPAPTPVAPPAPQVDPQKSADTDYLNSMIDGTANLLAPDVLEKLEPMFDKYSADAEMMGLLERAANAYGDAAVAAAKQALAA